MKKLFIFCLFFMVATVSFAESCTIRVGTPSYIELPAQLYQNIADKTGCNLSIQIYNQKDLLLKAAINKQLDLVFLKDFQYYLVKQQDYGTNLLATSLSYNVKENSLKSASYHSHIVTLNSDKINNIDDLNGKTIGLSSDHGSTSGYIFPLLLLKQHNIQPKNIIYATSTQLVALLEDGTIDATVLWDRPIITSGKLKIIDSSIPIPQPGVVSINLSKQQNTQIKKALLDNNINYHGFLVRGFVSPNTTEFNKLFKTYDQFCAQYPSDCKQ